MGELDSVSNENTSCFCPIAEIFEYFEVAGVFLGDR